MSRRFRFDDFEIDPQIFRLLQDGKALPVEPKSLNLLIFLVENRDRLIERRELIDAVWGDTFVTDHVLNRAIAQLRKLLADDSKEPRCIETVPTRGYRFIAQVEVEEVETKEPSTTAPPSSPQPRVKPGASFTPKPQTRKDSPGSSLRWRTAVAVALLALVALATGLLLRKSWGYSSSTDAPIRSLAVLPLQNLSGDSSQDYVADGMTVELITGLAQIGALRVISQTTAMQYKNAHKSLPQIAKELNVDAVIEGSVMRSNDQIQITAQLVDAPADKQIWAGRYDGSLADVTELENQVASAVAERIRIKVTSQEKVQLAGVHQVNPRAFDAFFKGEAALQDNNWQADEKALQLFQQAVQIDPNFARAYVAIARSYDLMGIPDPAFGMTAGEMTAAADAAEAKALAIDPALGEAYEERAWTQSKYHWDFPAAEADFRHALELEPGAPSAHDGLGHTLLVEGRVDEGLREVQIAQQLDPLSLVVNTDYCQVFRYARQYEKALAHCETALKLQPNYKFAIDMAILTYEQLRNYAAADKLLAKRGCDPSCVAMIDEIHGKPGVTGAFDVWLKKQKGTPNAYFLATAYAGLNRKDQAFAALERAYELRSDDSHLEFIGVDPQFDSLRSDPRFDVFLRHVGLPPQRHVGPKQTSTSSNN
jgi:TolB-like protein/DNA-binding winged helix-turn-helix (wHTH) protein/Tfp pilus assembly protein PilF